MVDVRRSQPASQEPRDRRERGPSRGSLMPILTVLGFTLALVLFLVALTGVAGLFALLAIGGLLGFIALHYALWGWWLGKAMRTDQQNAAAEDEADA